MRKSLAHPPPRRRRLLRVGAVTGAAVVLLGTVLTGTAAAHGSVVDPASRNFGCWKRWGDKFQSPEMATQDPMCDQAWKSDPNAMWNWNGLYIDGTGGDYRKFIPDGQLCSAGGTSDGRYKALDTPGAWKATPVGNSFTLELHDQAKHGADFLKVYVSKPGFDPTTQRLGWGDLQLVTETGRFAPGVGDPTSDPVLNGVSMRVPLSIPGRTGRAVLYTIWKASHSDQTYFLCSDVAFGGTSAPAPTTPAPSPTAPAPTTPAPTNPAPTTPAPSPTAPAPTTPAPTNPAPTTPAPAPGTGSCAAAYRSVYTWSGGYLGLVTVANGATAAKGWTVTWPSASGSVVNAVWGGKYAASAGTHTVTGTAQNSALKAKGRTAFWVVGTGAAPAAPTCSATV